MLDHQTAVNLLGQEQSHILYDSATFGTLC
jgi:hypothetical protein